jgi:hypothetical protein
MLGYTLQTVKTAVVVVIVILSFLHSAFGADETFSRIKVPDAKGKPISATLTFSDRDRAVEIRASNGNALVIP